MRRWSPKRQRLASSNASLLSMAKRLVHMVLVRHLCFVLKSGSILSRQLQLSLPLSFPLIAHLHVQLLSLELRVCVHLGCSQGSLVSSLGHGEGLRWSLLWERDTLCCLLHIAIALGKAKSLQRCPQRSRAGGHGLSPWLRHAVLLHGKRLLSGLSRLRYWLMCRRLSNRNAKAGEWLRSRWMGLRLRQGCLVMVHTRSNSQWSTCWRCNTVVSSTTTTRCGLRRIRPLLASCTLCISFVNYSFPFRLALVLLSNEVVLDLLRYISR